jgi:flagellar hook-basal body complex protein FliE
MTTIASNAVAAAYGAGQSAGTGGGMPAKPGGEGGGSFASMLEEAASEAVDTIRNAESTSLKAVSGEADLLEVVSSVNDAESTLRTVVAVRDKVVQSYQEILRMPI